MKTHPVLTVRQPPANPFDLSPDEGVQDTPVMTPFQSDILSTILYFDIFRHPVTAQEIYAFLPSNSTSPEAVERECLREPLSSLLDYERTYYFIRGAERDMVDDRLRKEELARRLLNVARVMTSVIRHFPFVRSVMLSGELSKGVSSPGGDIDFLIVTEPGRLWICRTILIAMKKTVLLNSKRFLCLNHLVSEESFQEQERNVYTATEIATLVPLHNPSLYSSYQRANSWVHSFFPNFRVRDEVHAHGDGRSVTQRVIEFLLPSRFAEWADRRLMEFWRRTWNHRYAHLPAETRRRLFRSDRSLSTAYGGDFMDRIMSEYSHRLKKHRCGERIPAGAKVERSRHD